MALSDNPGRFNREASEAFKMMTEEEREELTAHLPKSTPMTKGEIHKRAATIFHKIHKSVC